MSIPHIETIRELRAQAQAGRGAAELIQRVSSAQNELAMRRSAPADQLPGEALIEDLCTWPGLERLCDVDAPSSADWATRVRARELALQSALAVLQPLASSAHEASHAMHDLRKLQLEALEDPGLEDVRERVLAHLNQHAAATAEVRVLQQRMQPMAPLVQMVQLFDQQLRGALTKEGPAQGPLCDSFARAAVSSLTAGASRVGISHDVLADGDTPQDRARSVLSGLALFSDRLDVVSKELTKALDKAEADRARSANAVEEELG
ncbi:MAG: hypothetical protein KC912_04655 [Proteobacteria bacterium]|nr:hypothetical protein [Pseudomonadota bacterium]